MTTLLTVPTEAFQIPLHLERSVAAQRVDRLMRARVLARLAFGATLLGGVVGVAGAFIEQIPVVTTLGATWAAAVILWAVVRTLARFVPTAVDAGWDPLWGASYAVVGAGVGLLAPLSLHGAVAVVLGLVSPLKEFDGWVVMSAGLVGLAHIALAYQLAVRALLGADGEAPKSVARMFWIVVAWSCLPGAVAFLIPPILVAITGAAMIPFVLLFDAAIEREHRERRSIRERHA